MTDQINYTFDLNMVPEQDFENGMSLDIHILGGTDADTQIQSHPDYFKSNPITFGIELHVKNPESIPLIVQSLEGVKGMLTAIPQCETFINMGLQIELRQLESSVCVDVSFGGALAEQVAVGMSIMGNYKPNGKATFELTTGFKPLDALTQSFEQILQKLCQFKVKGISHFKTEKGALETLGGSLAGALNQVPGLENANKKATALFKALSILRELKYEYKYDNQELLNGATEVIKSISPEANMYDEISGKLAEGQMMATMSIEQGKMMAGMFLAPFAEALKAVSFDKITIFAYLSGTQILYKTSISLPGVDAYLNENILNSF
jgi:hypothetical protein